MDFATNIMQKMCQMQSTWWIPPLSLCSSSITIWRLQYMLRVPLKARNSSIIYSHEPVNASRHWMFEFKTRSLTV